MQKILIVSPGWVGDTMLMQPMLTRLKQRHPDCLIDIFAPSWAVALLRAMPEVNEIIINPYPHGALQLFARFQLGKRLRTAQYNQAIVLPNSLKSALVPFFARIPLRTGFVGELRYGLLNDARPLDKITLPLMVERFAQLAEAAGDPVTRPLSDPRLLVGEAQRNTTVRKLDLSPGGRIAVFCPGAEYGPAKRWPARYYAELAQRLQQHGYVIWIIGSGKDKPIADQIVQTAPDCRNLCGRTDLGDAIALLACAQLVVSNDSGLMHLAAALDRPMVALFGSSSPDFTPPLSSRATVLKLDLECSPCFKRECPLGHFNCMMQLTPEQVWQKIDSADTAK
jgi:heptosyltransferase-2